MCTHLSIDQTSTKLKFLKFELQERKMDVMHACDKLVERALCYIKSTLQVLCSFWSKRWVPSKVCGGRNHLFRGSR
jgi:hypothetical protein